MRKEGFTPEKYQDAGETNLEAAPALPNLTELLRDKRVKTLLTKFTQKWSQENL